MSLPTERRTSPEGPSSAFLSVSVDCLFDRLPLTDLHPVYAMTAWRLATTPSPSSVPYAGIFASHLRGQNGIGVPQFHRKSLSEPVAASCTPGGRRDNVCRCGSRHTNRLPILGRVFPPLSPVGYHDALTRGSSRQQRSQGWSVIHSVVHRCRTVVRTLQTLSCATVQRLVRSPYGVVRTSLLME